MDKFKLNQALDQFFLMFFRRDWTPNKEHWLTICEVF